MKVLRPGRHQAEWSREVTCTGAGNPFGEKGCYALLLVGRDDVFKTHVDDYGRGKWFITFKCPECGMLTDIQRLGDDSPNGVPDDIKVCLLPRLAWECHQARTRPESAVKQIEKAAQQAAEDMVTGGSPKLPSSDYVPTVVGRAGMYCRDCGAPEHLGNVFCPRCGAE